MILNLSLCDVLTGFINEKAFQATCIRLCYGVIVQNIQFVKKK